LFQYYKDTTIVASMQVFYQLFTTFVVINIVYK